MIMLNTTSHDFMIQMNVQASLNLCHFTNKSQLGMCPISIYYLPEKRQQLHEPLSGSMSAELSIGCLDSVDCQTQIHL